MAASSSRPAPARSLPDVTLPALELAPRLIGCLLVREVEGVRTSGVVVETEAYPGGEDEASHTRRGLRTRRNEAMWLEGGHAYVYFTYGMHWMCNVVSGAAGAGEAVLIRALRPVEGLEAMRRRRPGAADRDLCRGPARLAVALAIGPGLDGCDLLRRSGGRRGRDAGLLLEPAPPDAPEATGRVVASPRVGIGSAGPWAARPWRFSADPPDFVSRPLPVAARLWRPGPRRR